MEISEIKADAKPVIFDLIASTIEMSGVAISIWDMKNEKINQVDLDPNKITVETPIFIVDQVTLKIVSPTKAFFQVVVTKPDDSVNIMHEVLVNTQVDVTISLKPLLLDIYQNIPTHYQSLFSNMRIFIDGLRS